MADIAVADRSKDVLARPELFGKWVALRDGAVVAFDADRDALREALRARGTWPVTIIRAQALTEATG